MKLLIPIILAAVFIPFLIWIFYVINKERKKVVIKTSQDLQQEGIQDLKCPRCNSYMQVGYTIAGKGMFFRDRHKRFNYFSTENLVPNTATLGFRMKENLAWKCNNCQLLVIDYSFQVKKQGRGSRNI